MTDETKGAAGDWITVKEAQKVIGGKRTVTARTVRRWIARHNIPTHRQYRDGGYTLLLARQEVEALTDPDKALGKVRAQMSEVVKVTDWDKWTKNVREQLDAGEPGVQGVTIALWLDMEGDPIGQADAAIAAFLAR